MQNVSLVSKSYRGDRQLFALFGVDVNIIVIAGKEPPYEELEQTKQTSTKQGGFPVPVIYCSNSG